MKPTFSQIHKKHGAYMDVSMYVCVNMCVCVPPDKPIRYLSG